MVDIKEKISEIETRLQLLLTLSMFFPSVVSVFFEYSGEPESVTRLNVLNSYIIVVAYIFSYILFQCVKAKEQSYRTLQWIDGFLYLGLASYIFPIVIFAKPAVVINMLSQIPFAGSLALNYLAPVLLIVLLAARSIKYS